MEEAEEEEEDRRRRKRRRQRRRRRGMKRGREIRRREVRPLGEVEGGGEGRGRG